MIDWRDLPEEDQQKFKFENARVMGNHMIDNGVSVHLSVGESYYWHLFLGDESYSCFKDEDFDRLVKDYLHIIE